MPDPTAAPRAATPKPVSRRFIAAVTALLAIPPAASLSLNNVLAADAARLQASFASRPAPIFKLDPVDGLDRPGVSAADLRIGRVVLVNLFASWCGPCRMEAPDLMELSRSGVDILGIAVRDAPANTRRFLQDVGDPYKGVGVDRGGDTAGDFGITGLPETFAVKGDGTIVAQIVGPLDDEIIRTRLVPAIAKALR